MPPPSPESSTPRVILNRENPWPGLATFDEESHSFFYGRSSALTQLVALVQRTAVTLLYGRSGLGKSSLINAGLFFELRKEPREYFPIPVTLRFSTVQSQEISALDYLVQRVKDDIAAALAAAKIDARPPASNETLYEYFHREDIDFWDKRNRPLTAVLVFDQFEELFTLGASDDLARKRTEYFLQEFTALAEGVHTAPVRRRFEENPGAKGACDFDKRNFKIVLCIREDFLPHLADREELFPSVLRQSMRLEELSRDEALKVVEKPGGHLVAPGVAEQIVDFVSGSWSSETANGNHTHRPAKRGVDPSILSLVCQQLNDQRKARQKKSGVAALIETAQLAGGGAERIIEQYYRESVADLPALGTFIEQGLVTREGHRCALPENDALAKEGVYSKDVNFLVRNRRILLREVEDGVRWLRLSHDRLAAVARQSRGEREIEEQRLLEERRRKEAEQKQAEAEALQAKAEAAAARAEEGRRYWLRIALACVSVLLLLAVGALWFALREWRRAEKSAVHATEQSEYAFKEKERADKAADAAAKSASFAEGQRMRAETEEGRAWIERAKLNFARGSNFAAALMAARALGFAGYGREKIVDPKFNEEYPVLLSTVNDPIDEQEARREMNEAALTGYFGRPLWQTPVYHQHEAPVLSVAWSPDGRTLASGSSDRTVKLWEAATGKLLATLQGHTGEVYSIAWSPDGKTLASGSDDRTVMLWDAATGKLLMTLQGHAGEVLSVAWSPDGRTLASGSSDWTVKLWEAGTGKLLATLQGHTGEVYSIAWSPDGKTLASGSSDQSVKLWEAGTGQLLSTLQGHADSVLSVAWSSDGKTLASGSSDRTVKLWEAALGKLLATLQGHTGSVYSVAWSADGKTLASGSDDRTVKLWDAATGKLLATLQGHANTVYSVAWSSDGKTLASGSGDKTVKLWEAATGKLLTTLQGHTDSVLSVVWSPDGKTLASGSSDQSVKLWEAATGKLLTTLQGHTGVVESVAWSPDGKTLASGSYDKTVKLWEAATGKLLVTLHGHTGGGYSVAWSPDGKTLASGSGDQTVKLWEAGTGKLLATLQGHTDSVLSVVWSPDGKTLASGSSDQTVKLWEAATGKLLTTLQGHTGVVESVAWRPDGKTLASGSRDQTVKLWDAARSKLVSTLHGHTGGVYSVAWNPDGKTLASGSRDQSVKLWEAATGKLLTTLQGHANTVYGVAWSSDPCLGF
jgi:WD40 repeat protein